MRQLNNTTSPTTPEFVTQIDYSRPIVEYAASDWPFYEDLIRLKSTTVWIRRADGGAIVIKPPSSISGAYYLDQGDILGHLTDGTPFVLTPDNITDCHRRLANKELHIDKDLR